MTKPDIIFTQHLANVIILPKQLIKVTMQN